MQQRLLVVDPTTRRNGFDRLKDPAKAATLGKFKARLAHLQELDDLGATRCGCRCSAGQDRPSLPHDGAG
ncbi:hypothetical protein ACWDKQ_19745 [Saccharopolyspora sp. NPDC000995]